MEAEVGTPIEYNPDEFINKNSTGLHDEREDREEEEVEDQQYYTQPAPHQVYYNPQPQYQEKNDIFTNLDKTGYIIIFVAFLLGFFMGKTMQPVILRPG